MTQYVLSLSYGKDSLACLAAIEQLGLPLDRIVHAEVWATDTIPADLPPMVEFKKKADAIIKERWGIEVEHIWATKPRERERERGFTDSQCSRETGVRAISNNGLCNEVVSVLHRGTQDQRYYGFPISVRQGNWCTALKQRVFQQLPCTRS